MKNKIYIITSSDEWLTTILINKFKKNNTITLIKVKKNKIDYLKLLKFLILFGVIDMIKILITQKIKKKYNIITIKKCELNEFIKNNKKIKFFLVNYTDKIEYNYKNIYNCHPSLLPNYKGLMPIPRYLWDFIINNKKNEIGLTIHKINQKFDSGKIMWNKIIKIKKNILLKDLYEKIYSNFYYGIVDILSSNSFKLNHTQVDKVLKNNLSLLEIFFLKINLLKKNIFKY